MVLTNGAGGINRAYVPGQVVLISDHIKLTAHSPLVGAAFIDLTDLYSSRLRGLVREGLPSLQEGVYVQLPGPQYETPAEIRMLTTMGGDLVGMSTTIEAIATREARMELLGLSLVTYQAAGIQKTALNHQEVRYRVTQTRVVQPEDTETLRQVAGKDLLTLVTCTPLGINTERMLVTAERVAPTPDRDLTEALAPAAPDRFPWWLTAYTAGLVAIGVFLWQAGLEPRPRT